MYTGLTIITIKPKRKPMYYKLKYPLEVKHLKRTLEELLEIEEFKNYKTINIP